MQKEKVSSRNRDSSDQPLGNVLLDMLGTGDTSSGYHLGTQKMEIACWHVIAKPQIVTGWLMPFE